MRSRSGDKKWPAFALAGVFLAALLLKLALLLCGAIAFDSDEAIVGLMARHILEGERPVFFYGQAYMGSLDAWLVAGLFALCGPSVAAIRAVQVALFLVHVALTYLLVWRWSGDRATALLSALLMAWPPVLLTLYTSVSLGGYVEMLVLGDLVLLVGCRLAAERSPGQGLGSTSLWWAVLGLLAGLGFWTLALIAVYLLPLGVLLLWRHRGRAWPGYLLAAAAFLAGSAPWWAYNLGHNWQGALALLVLSATKDLPAGAGEILRSVREPLAQNGSKLVDVLPLRTRALGFFLIGLPGLVGVRLPWLAEWLSPLAVLPVALFYAAVALYAWTQARRNAWHGAYRLLWGMALSFVALFVSSRFGSDPTGRYFLPLYTPLTAFAAAALVALGRAERGQPANPFADPSLRSGLRLRAGVFAWVASRARWGASKGCAAIGVALLLAFHLWGTWVGASSVEGLTAQYNPQLQYGNAYDEELIAFLEANAGTRGYTHYWIAFKIAFLSGERVILAPSLPHKASGHVVEADKRYPLYAGLVSSAECVVYVTGNQPALDADLRQGFARRGIAYREQAIGPYRVFYGLSQPVLPSELDPRWCGTGSGGQGSD